MVRKKSSPASAARAAPTARDIEGTRAEVTAIVGVGARAAPAWSAASLATAALALLACASTSEQVEEPVQPARCARPGHIYPSETPYLLGGYMPAPTPRPAVSVQPESPLCALDRSALPAPIRDLALASCPPIAVSASVAPTTSAPPTTNAPSSDAVGPTLDAH